MACLFGGQKVIGIFWSELRVWAQGFLTAPSLLCHTLVQTPTEMHAHVEPHWLNVNARTCSCTLRHPAQWLGALAKFLNLPFCILSWWEQTSWKQWKGLICGFVSGFDKGPCSKPKFLWPLVKNVSSLAAHPSYSCSLYEKKGEWITRDAVSLIKPYSLFHPHPSLQVLPSSVLYTPRQLSHSPTLSAF